ncbi:MAG: alanine--glyoxylate aminotransferase family protein [Candidatus Thermoplasmatota archaeon]|nr:alanine--glyoxylate aminotransferase family protein [Candidatus Thermoplasmatota archaeon]
MKGDLEDNIFMLAGPVKMHPRVIKAMLRPALNHRSKEYSEILAEVRELLKYTFNSQRDVALITGSGTAGLDCALSNLLKPKDKVLCPYNGKFGERLYKIAQLYASATALTFEWGKVIDIKKVEEELKKGYDAIVLCHNETSTGMTNQAGEIGKLAKKYGCYYIVDGITSVGGIVVEPEAWNIDILVTGSQKCLAAPAGLSALSVSQRAYERLEPRNYYLDLKKHIDRLKNNDTPYTPAVPLVLALREALVMLKEEGLETRIKRTSKLADACRKASEGLGLELFSEGNYSNTLTAIKYPNGISDELRKNLFEEHRVIVAGAQDPYKGKFFRIGHMGICSFSDLLATFGALEASLKKFGYNASAGALEAIAKCL